jgi:hypothetical protein
LEPEKYECGISAIVFVLGTDPVRLGLDMTKYEVVRSSRKTLRFSELNIILDKCIGGGGKAIVLKQTKLMYETMFQREDVAPLCSHPALLSVH